MQQALFDPRYFVVLVVHQDATTHTCTLPRSDTCNSDPFLSCSMSNTNCLYLILLYCSFFFCSTYLILHLRRQCVSRCLLASDNIKQILQQIQVYTDIIKQSQPFNEQPIFCAESSCHSVYCIYHQQTTVCRCHCAPTPSNQSTEPILAQGVLFPIGQRTT